MNLLSKLAVTVGGAYVGLRIARAIVRQQRDFDWKGKRVVITGGSRGLGLVIARKLADRGARLAIMSRSAEDLTVAANELNERGAEVISKVCDVREQNQVDTCIGDVVDRFDGVDVLINVAGIISVGPFDSMTIEDFRDSMQTNFWGALHMTLAVLPSMRLSGWGRIVNIASMGGKRAVPHMLPYAASKFALVGFSNGLRAELKQENIFVTTACPGLMRTGSPRNATFKGKHRAEYAWFSIGDSLPGISMHVSQAADQILLACQHGRGEVMIRSPLNLAIEFQRFFPEITEELLGIAAMALPKMGGIGRDAAKGYESESAWSKSFLTTLTRNAAVANNEL